jgi:alkanesulfonate monooxygenase SsuD/methylene tetrahydromethanopterin reductase-like flavin-dependent oxidoreductase (luciferase family)
MKLIAIAIIGSIAYNTGAFLAEQHQSPLNFGVAVVLAAVLAAVSRVCLAVLVLMSERHYSTL